MALKDTFDAILLKRCGIIFLLCFIALSSAAPAQQLKDRAVLRWLKDWNGQLEKIAWTTFNRYNDVHFSDRVNNMPYLMLGILKQSLIAKNMLSPKNVSNAVSRQLLDFITPVYLAYYDESQRSNSDAELTKLLLNLSAVLNSTTEIARYLYVRKFPDANQPQATKDWSRDVMDTTVAIYKFHPRIQDPNSVNELRSWATLSELIHLPSKLKNLFKQI